MTSRRTLNYLPAIEECYNAETNLMSIWHDPDHHTTQHCIDDCLKDLTLLGSDFEFYRIEEEGQLLGFFGKQDNTLVTFWVHTDARARKVAIWDFIASHFKGTPFVVGLHDANKRAFKFLTSRGGEYLGASVNHNGHLGHLFRF